MEVKNRLPLNCPSCNNLLVVSKLFCKECKTEVSGSFGLPVFTKLSKKEQLFVLDFVKSSGSLKDMAKNLSLSYPTVRNILDDLIEKINKL